jgi:ABC-type nickel/cobalt efflux system permease component RcnA
VRGNVLGGRHILGVFLLLLLVPAAQAHPVPRDNHDRTLVVRLTPEAVVVEYRLEVDEYRATLDMPRAELAGVDSRKGFYAAFARYHADLLANNLAATLDGRTLEFTCVGQRYQLLDHVRCDFRFRAPWTLSAGGAHRFTFRECNYEQESFNVVLLSLDNSPQLTLRDVTVPDEELLARPAAQRKPGDDERLRRASAVVLSLPSFLPGVARLALPPDPELVRDGASEALRGVVGRAKPVPSYPTGIVRDTPPPEKERASGAEHAHSSLLNLFLDTHQGLAVLLLLAAGFGAAHALTPGHGKTLVAAYLIGQRGTIAHALALGLVTTLTHTGGVIILAILLAVWFRGVSPGAVQAALGLVGGLLIAGLGLWLLLQRLTGRADHVHLFGGHHHHHDHEPAHPPMEARAGWGQIVLLGISGGIIPCWDAIAMLLLALASQRLWLGVPLLLAFSVGLASVLVVLGIVVVRAGEAARARFGEGERFQKVVRALPIASAAVITILGLGLTFAAARAVP